MGSKDANATLHFNVENETRPASKTARDTSKFIAQLKNKRIQAAGSVYGGQHTRRDRPVSRTEASRVAEPAIEARTRHRRTLFPPRRGVDRFFQPWRPEDLDKARALSCASSSGRPARVSRGVTRKNAARSAPALHLGLVTTAGCGQPVFNRCKRKNPFRENCTGVGAQRQPPFRPDTEPETNYVRGKTRILARPALNPSSPDASHKVQ